MRLILRRYNSTGTLAGYLTATGTTAGATSQAQTFTNGVKTTKIIATADGVTGWYKADGTTAILTVNTSANIVAFNSSFTVAGNASVSFSGANSLNLNNTTGDNAYIEHLGAGVTRWVTGLGITAFADQYVIYSSTLAAAVLTALPSGYVGVGTSPTAALDVSASTTTRASLRLRQGSRPTTPNAGDAWNDGAIGMYQIDATTNAVVNSLIAERASSGTPAAGFGLAIATRLASSTTANRDAGRLFYQWVIATDASRASRGKLSAYYTTTEQTAMTWDGDTGGLKLSFYGGVPVARQLLATGAGRTVDDVITALQALSLVRQS